MGHQDLGGLTALSLLGEGSSSPSDATPRSQPVHVGRPHGGSPDHQTRDVLRLLDAGLKDEAIARQLGVSLRTVQRLVRLASEQLDVGSRFQLGAEAARRGLI